MKLDDLREPEHFEVEVAQLGPLRVKKLTLGSLQLLGRAVDGTSLVRAILQKEVDRPDATSLTSEDIAQLPDEALDLFAAAYINAHPDILLDDISVKGDRVTVKRRGESVIQKEKDETARQYLFRLFRTEVNKFGSLARKIAFSGKDEARLVSELRSLAIGLHQLNSPLLELQKTIERESQVGRLLSENFRIHNPLAEMINKAQGAYASIHKSAEAQIPKTVSEYMTEFSDKIDPIGAAIKRAAPLSGLVDKIDPSITSLGIEDPFRYPLGADTSSRVQLDDTHLAAKHARLEPLLTIPKNPVHETNERLEGLERLAFGMHDLSLKMGGTVEKVSADVGDYLTKFEQSVAGARKAGVITTGLTVVAIGVAIFTFFWGEYRGSSESEGTIKLVNDVLGRIDALTTELKVERANGTEAQEQFKSTVQAGSDRTEAAIRDGDAAVANSLIQLSESLDRLSSQLQERDAPPPAR